MISKIGPGSKIDFGFQFKPTEGAHHFSREDWIHRLEEDLASGGYELGPINWAEADKAKALFITVNKVGEELTTLVLHPYIPPEGVTLNFTKSGRLR